MITSIPTANGTARFEPGVTLQINVSAGDLSYLEATLSRLVRQFGGACSEVLLVVDCCRPQATKMVDPDKRFPVAEFQGRVKRLQDLVVRIGKEVGVDRCVFLEQPRDGGYFEYLAAKYVGFGVIPKGVTHSGGGTAFMSYWAAFDLPETRYVLHFDADMIVRQPVGCDWVAEAIAKMEKDFRFVTAIPRNSPPMAGDSGGGQPQRDMGRPLENINGDWANDWFSTRIMLMDRKRLAEHLPLLSLQSLGSTKFFLEMWARRLGRRAFPRDPEIILFKRMSDLGLRSLILKRPDVWSLHPEDKGAWFVENLSELFRKIDKDEIPEGQRGFENIIVEAWQAELGTAPEAS